MREETRDRGGAKTVARNPKAQDSERVKQNAKVINTLCFSFRSGLFREVDAPRGNRERASAEGHNHKGIRTKIQ